MDPISDYQIGKALHKEREAEFEQYRRWHQGAAPSSSERNSQALAGVVSIILMALIAGLWIS